MLQQREDLLLITLQRQKVSLPQSNKPTWLRYKSTLGRATRRHQARLGKASHPCRITRKSSPDGQFLHRSSRGTPHRRWETTAGPTLRCTATRAIRPQRPNCFPQHLITKTGQDRWRPFTNQRLRKHCRRLPRQQGTTQILPNLTATVLRLRQRRQGRRKRKASRNRSHTCLWKKAKRSLRRRSAHQRRRHQQNWRLQNRQQRRQPTRTTESLLRKALPNNDLSDHGPCVKKRVRIRFDLVYQESDKPSIQNEFNLIPSENSTCVHRCRWATVQHFTVERPCRSHSLNAEHMLQLNPLSCRKYQGKEVPMVIAITLPALLNPEYPTIFYMTESGS